VTNYDTGPAPVFGIGGAKCDAPGVEEGDIAFVGPIYMNTAEIGYRSVFTMKDTINLTFINYDIFTRNAGWAGVIVLKKSITPPPSITASKISNRHSL
jgi:hypothetical protein